MKKSYWITLLGLPVALTAIVGYPFPVQSQSSAEPLKSSLLAQNRQIRLLFKNECSSTPLRMAVRFYDSSENWVTQSWYSFTPGEGPTGLRNVSSSNRIFYAYAEATDNSRRVWSGDHQVTIDGRSYQMLRVEIPAGTTEFTQRFTCTNESPTPSPNPNNSSRVIQIPAAESLPDNFEWEQSVHRQVNQYRQRRGLPPLQMDSFMSEQARQHSENMAAGRVPFSHDGVDQRYRMISQRIPYSSVAENVAFNFGHSDPMEQAVQGWINSPGHHTNMTGNYELTGIGVARNSKGEYYFTQLFLRRR